MIVNYSELALVIFILWFLFLFGAIACLRAYLATNGLKAANSFSPGGYDVSDFSGRLCRAHANCYESFPFIGGLLLCTIATDKTSITDDLAMFLVACRIIQSSIHLVSTSIRAVQLRFTFFLVQYCIAAYWTLQLLANAQVL